MAASGPLNLPSCATSCVFQESSFRECNYISISYSFQVRPIETSIGAMSLPVTLSPKLSRELPLPKRKRRETVDLTGDDDVAALRTAGDPASSSRPIDRPTANEPERRIDDDELSDDEDKSIFEDALDEIELNPFRPLSEDEALSDNEATMLQAELRQIGIDSFIRKHLSSQKYPPRLLGTAFGIE